MTKAVIAKRAAIVTPLRTPVGTFGGALRPLHAHQLASTVVKAVVQKSRVAPEAIDEVVFAQSYANSEAPCIGRWVALDAGLPLSVSGIQVDRRCGGGLQSIITAAMMVQTGSADVVIAGGVESMSNIEHYSADIRWGSRSGSVALYDRLDRGRERSQPEWRFGPISGMEPVTVTRDEGVRPESSTDTLSRLRTLMPDGTVTAGNSSQQNDAAAACLVVAEDKLAELGLDPIGFFVDWAAIGCEPATMGLGPVGAVSKLFARTGMTFDDMALVELNEAFAAQVLAVLEEWKWFDENKLGGELGHIARSPDRRDGRPDGDDDAARAEATRRRTGTGNHVHRWRSRPGRRLPERVRL